MIEFTQNKLFKIYFNYKMRITTKNTYPENIVYNSTVSELFYVSLQMNYDNYKHPTL